MSDLASLPPAQQAALMGRPDGEAGISAATLMNQTNRMVTEAVYRRLALTRGYHVLEIGFGNGALLPNLMQHAASLTYVGVDISPTMVAEATRFNQTLVDSGRAAFHLASVEQIPSPDASFARAFGVNGIYFWPDPVKALAEIHRVLRPDAMSIIAAIDPETAAPLPFARDEFGFRVRDAATLSAFHRDAGFDSVAVETYDEITTRPDGTAWPRRYYFVIAQKT